jgi:hypothetical protein
VTQRQSNSGACRAKTGNDASHLLGDKYRGRRVEGRLGPGSEGESGSDEVLFPNFRLQLSPLNFRKFLKIKNRPILTRLISPMYFLLYHNTFFISYMD